MTSLLASGENTFFVFGEVWLILGKNREIDFELWSCLGPLGQVGRNYLPPAPTPAPLPNLCLLKYSHICMLKYVSLAPWHVSAACWGALSCLTQHMVLVGCKGIIVGIWLAGLIGLGGFLCDTRWFGNNYHSAEIGKSEQESSVSLFWNHHFAILQVSFEEGSWYWIKLSFLSNPGWNWGMFIFLCSISSLQLQNPLHFIFYKGAYLCLLRHLVY